MRRFAAAFAVFIILAAPIPDTSVDDDYFAIRKNFEIFGSIYEDLVLEYVDDVDAERLMRAGIRAMLAELDPYTVFLDEAVNEQINIAVQGKTGTPGLSIGSVGGQIVVLSPEFGAAGYKAGVRTGDVIISIDGNLVDDLSAADARNLLYGDPGTTVEVVVERSDSADNVAFLISRERIRFTNVSYSGLVTDEAGKPSAYIKLDRFGRNATTEVRRSLDTLLTESPESVILDLRDNPGGLLGEAVGIVSLFVPPGTPVVSTIGRRSETDELYRSEGRPVYDGRLTVLINEFSASASEIVAGALQDHDRAVVLGKRSFGKGLVQVINDLPYHTSLKITTSRYFIPSGRSIQNVLAGTVASGAVSADVRRSFKTGNGRAVYDGAGIDPDISVGTIEEAEIVQALKRQSAFFAFANHYRASGAVVDENFEVGDDVFDAFKQWLSDQSFDFETEADRMITLTREALRESEFSTEALGSLEQSVQLDKARELDRRSDTVKRYLYEEILGRYLDDRDFLRAITGSDETVGEAMRVAGSDVYPQTLGQ